MAKRPDAHRSRVQLTSEFVEKIVGLIRNWPANRVLRWNDVIAQTKAYIRHEWTRQGLERHNLIKEAYEAKRKEFRAFKKTGKVAKLRFPEEEAREQQIARLTQELEKLRRIFREYDDLFVRYQANALKHGLTLAQLEAPLLRVDRATTDSTPITTPRKIK